LIALGLSLPARGRRFIDEAYLLIPAAAWICLGVILARSHGYVSHRHVSPAALLLLAHAGLGAAGLSRFGAPWLKKIWPSLPEEKGATGILASLAVILAVLGSTSAFRTYRAGKVHMIGIGRELRETQGAGKVIVGNRIRIAFYAEGRHHDLPPFHDLPEVASFLLETEAQLLVIDVLDSHFPVRHAEIRSHFANPEAPPEGFTFLNRWKVGPETGRERDICAYSIDPSGLRRLAGREGGIGEGK
ncbi:MAG: hypothetical protein ACYTFG_19620, partial [Planctomycetota bacterium]